MARPLAITATAAPTVAAEGDLAGAEHAEVEGDAVAADAAAEAVDEPSRNKNLFT